MGWIGCLHGGRTEIHENGKYVYIESAQMYGSNIVDQWWGQCLYKRLEA